MESTDNIASSPTHVSMHHYSGQNMDIHIVQSSALAMAFLLGKCGQSCDPETNEMTIQSGASRTRLQPHGRFCP